MEQKGSTTKLYKIGCGMVALGCIALLIAYAAHLTFPWLEALLSIIVLGVFAMVIGSIFAPE